MTSKRVLVVMTRSFTGACTNGIKEGAAPPLRRAQARSHNGRNGCYGKLGQI